MDRPGYKITAGGPGSDLAGETAAALAAAAVLFKDSDPGYSDTCIQHAKELFEFADGHRGKYQDSICDAGNFYGLVTHRHGTNNRSSNALRQEVPIAAANFIRP